MQKKNTKRNLAIAFLSLLLAASMLALPVSAAKISVTPPTVQNTSTASYARVPIYLPSGERLSSDGYLISSTTYVPLRAAFAALYPQAKLTYSAKNREATLSGGGINMSVQDRSHVVYANGRCLYTDMPVRILADGTMYLPLRTLAQTLSLSVSWNEKSRSASLSGTAKPLESGESFYDADAVHWLARIISAEARGEPFIGQVAVGNVVLNRMRHKEFPNTIYGVIFDKRGGIVQFSPVSDGSIWKEPTASSITAAKVCLEGYSVSEKILFFYAPAMVSYTWIAQNRPYAFTIAGHRFYN